MIERSSIAYDRRFRGIRIFIGSFMGGPSWFSCNDLSLLLRVSFIFPFSLLRGYHLPRENDVTDKKVSRINDVNNELLLYFTNTTNDIRTNRSGNSERNFKTVIEILERIPN